MILGFNFEVKYLLYTIKRFKKMDINKTIKFFPSSTSKNNQPSSDSNCANGDNTQGIVETKLKSTKRDYTEIKI